MKKNLLVGFLIITVVVITFIAGGFEIINSFVNSSIKANQTNEKLINQNNASSRSNVQYTSKKNSNYSNHAPIPSTRAS